MTKEKIIDGLVEIIAHVEVMGSFAQAYAKDKPYYYKAHKQYIIPTIMINKQFKCPLFKTDVEVSSILFELGCKRTTRQIYEHSKPVKVVSCWVIPDNIF